MVGTLHGKGKEAKERASMERGVVRESYLVYGQVLGV
jgi:hypothetical protein